MTPERCAGCRLLSSSIVLLPLIYLLLTFSVNAQSGHDISGSSDDGASLVEEMRAKSDIKYAEKAHLEDLDRAREAAQLGSEMYSSFSRNNILGQAEKKKLDRLEKVTRKIRNQAGGSDGDVAPTDNSTQLGPLLKRLSDSANELRKDVEKTPRQIVSAAVIERSNEILELIRFVRALTH